MTFLPVRSQRLAPTFDTLAEEIADEKIHIAKVDCTKDGPLCQTHGVKGYPTLQLFKGGSTTGVPHSGDRSLGALKTFVESA